MTGDSDRRAGGQPDELAVAERGVPVHSTVAHSLERRIAGRYLRSRQTKRAASLNTIIATGGVAVGVLALIVVLGVMNACATIFESVSWWRAPISVLTFGRPAARRLASGSGGG